MYKRRMTDDEVPVYMRMRKMDDGHLENERTGLRDVFFTIQPYLKCQVFQILVENLLRKDVV